MEWKEYGDTVRPTNGLGARQIGYIFSEMEIKNYRKVTAPGELGSDHSLLLIQVELSLPP
jgi:hypothetical protein